MQPGGRNDIVESYFRLGLDYTEILLYLVLFHGIILSLRQLKRILKAKGLVRKSYSLTCPRFESKYNKNEKGSHFGLDLNNNRSKTRQKSRQKSRPKSR